MHARRWVEQIRVPQPWPTHRPSEVGKKKEKGGAAPRSRYKTTLDSVVSGTASYGEADDLGNWPKEDLDQHPRHLAQREMIAPEERKRGEKALGRVRSRGIRRPHAAASARLSM